ncbi:MAG: hypothetical protein ACPGUV_04030 [Polyangiales bacterium]
MERTRFELEANLPPTLQSAPRAGQLGTALDQIVSVDLSDVGLGTAGQEKEFPVIIRDPNKDQALFWQSFLNFDPAAPTGAIDGDRLAATGTEERELTLFLPPTAFREGTGCYKYELLVSSAFSTALPSREPVEEHDLATALWWVRVTDAADRDVDLNECPR